MEKKDKRELIIVGLVSGVIVSITYPLQISTSFSGLFQTLMEWTMGSLMIIATFRIPPADEHLFDPGPYYGIYFGMLLIVMFYALIKEKRQSKLIANEVV